MRTTLVLLAFCCMPLLASPAAGALAPNYQRLAEMRAVLDDPGVTAELGAAGPIDRVEYLRSDLYRVSAARCRLDVRIVGVPLPSGMAGPRRFEVRPGRKICK